MNIKILFRLTALLLLSMLLQIATAQSKADDLLRERNEVYISFEADDLAQLASLSRIISIDRVDRTEGLLVFAYMNRIQYNQFLDYDITFEILESPGINPQAVTIDWEHNKSVQSWNTYPTYPSYVSMMYEYETNYPELCEVISIGESVNNRKILYLKITNQNQSTFPKPRFNYSSTMHGDETTGFVLMLRLIDHLLSNYGMDAEVTQLIDDVEIWINPNANPDGTYYGGDNTVGNAIRYNANGADLNRNFKDFQDGDHPDNMPWQPETMAFMALADSIHFVMGANFHGGVEVVNYPWDTQAALNADNAWWMLVSHEYADTAQFFSGGNGYMTYLNDGITNGFAWYEANGTRQDYMNYYHRSREFTLEISTVKNPAASTLPNYWEYNFRSMMNYMKHVNYGVRGIVSDSLTGSPLLASVTINGYDNYNSDVKTEMPYGVYYRPLSSGTYAITYSAQGYQSKTILTTIANYQQVIQNVQLTMASPLVLFNTDSDSSCTGIIQFINQSNAAAGSSILWDFGDGSTSTEWSPLHQYLMNGNYTVSLNISNTAGNSTYVYPVQIEVSMPMAPGLTEVALCSGENAVISGTDNNTLWFSSSESTQAIYQGAQFVSGPLYTDTLFYAENIVTNPSLFTGKPDNSGSGSYFTNSQIHYLIFDCFKASRLKRVTLYSNSSGSKVITLRDDAGNILQSRTVILTNLGEQTVDLDFDLPIASNLRLAGPANPGFYRNNDPSTIQYPYEIEDLISIKNSSAGSGSLSYYYYFYNWEIEPAPCRSTRESVSVQVYETVPSADFSYTIIGDTVYFTNNSESGLEFEWNFGEGTSTSGEISPWYVYSSSGSYSVSLQASNPCGSDSYEKEIEISLNIVEQRSEKAIRIYPNPVKDELQFELLFEIDLKNPEISIYDLSGRLMRPEDSVPELSGKQGRINLSYLESGIYTLIIKTSGILVPAKFILVR